MDKNAKEDDIKHPVMEQTGTHKLIESEHESNTLD